MKAQELIEDLERAGVRLWLDGDRLRFRAPRGVMTDDRKSLVGQHREDVIATLRRGGLPAAVADPKHAHEPFPLTDVQAAYLMGRYGAYELGGVGCHSYLELAFPDLDPARLERSWQRVIHRHPMLRAVVSHDGEQRVLTDTPAYRVPVTDVRDASPEEIEDVVAAVRADLDHRVYDPERWPLFTLRLTRCPGRDLLHLSVDMLIADFVSIQVLLADLDRCYRGEALHAPKVTFRDYVVAERGLVGTSDYERSRAYWWSRLDELPPAPELPLAGDGAPTPEPPAGVQPRFARHTTTLGPDAWKRLRENAARQGITPSAALLGAYAEVVARWSRSPRFTLNLTLQGRLPLCEEVGELVGDFTSIVPLAVDGGAHSTFADRVRAVSEQLFDDLDHRVFPGVEVLREVARRRGQAGAHMPVVFTSALGLGEAATSGGLMGTGEFVYGVSQTPQVRLDCQAVEHRGSLVVNWDVREGAFPEQMIDEAFAAFSALLDTLSSGESWDAASPIALPERQQQERATVNAISAAPTGLLHDPVLAQAQRRPDAVAVIDQSRSITYAELVASGRHLAATVNGVGPSRGPGALPDDDEAPVAVLVDKGIDQVIAVLGVLMAGRAYLPIDRSQPRARRDAILADAGVRVGVTDTLHPDLPPGIADLPVVPLGCTEPTTELSCASAAATAYVVYTSGSTGTPKGVQVSHRAARSTIDDVVTRLEAGPHDRILGLASLGFDLSVFDIFGTLGAGGTLVLPDPGRRGDPSHWAQVVAEHQVTIWNSVPAQLQMLGQYLRSHEPATRPDCTSLRQAMLSGDWIPISLLDEMSELVPELCLIGLGGATEAAIWSNWYPIRSVPDHWRSIPYGAPLAAHRFHIRDAAGQERPDWVAGELYIGGHGLANGYLGDPKRTAAAFVTDANGENLYRTGDLARWLPGAVVEFLGRDDTQVKIRGHRIELTEIESALQNHPAVEAAAVIADGTALGRRLVAFVVPVRGGPSTVGPLRDRAAQDASAVLAGADQERLSTFAMAMDRAALLSMAHGLRELGLFVRDADRYATDELLSATGAAPRNRRVVRRWLSVLQDHDLLHRDGDGRWHRLTAVDEHAREEAWNDLELAHRGLDDGAGLMAFLRSCAARLPQIVVGADSALALLFPHGDVSTANAAYRDNIISRYVNRGVTSIMAQIAAGHPGTLRVLEVGAGVGGTTAEVLPAIAGHDVDYLFTDLSRFFLNDAQERFAAYPGLRYGLFDINSDPAEQDLRAGSLDVVLCANVLHNALDADVVIARLRDLLVPGGHIVFIETVKENYSVMMSMEFLLTFDEAERPDFTDVRQGRDQNFLARDEWLDVLDRAGGTVQTVLPGVDGTLAQFGQAVFAVQFGEATSSDLTPSSLGEHLRERLPEPMLPSRVEILERLPLTANGKVDRAALLARVPEGPRSGEVVREPPRDDLERRVAALWSDLLGVESVDREDDFFELGGDSLLLSRLAERLRTQVPEAASALWEELIPQLLSRPTVAELVAHLRTHAPRTPIIPLRGVAAADQPLRVLVHDGTATLVPYRALIEELDDVALVGVAPPSLAEYLARPGKGLVAHLATGYADLMAGHREIELVGYCMGGMIALELARALAGRGCDVRRLTVISSHRVPYLVHDEGLVEYGFARLRGLDPAAVGLPSDATALGSAVRERLRESAVIQAGSLDDHLGAYTARPREERLAALARAAGESASQLELGLRVFTHSINGVARWNPKTYAGPVTFVRQTSREAFLPGGRDDEPTAFWRELCTEELSVVDVPGDHFSCVQAPQVAEVAAVIRAPRS